MIDLTEEEIIKNWDLGLIDKPLVSVRYLAHNDEAFAEQAMDSFLMQKTNFPFEIVAHDDASTDRTAEIIREYERRFPRIVKPVYEQENQHSKGLGALKAAVDIHLRGKYIAYCDGDDRWIDENKLQLQADYMEAHPECALVTHNTRKHFLDDSKDDTLFNEWLDVHVLNEIDVFLNYKVHTSSFFKRSGCDRALQSLKEFWAGDYALLTKAFHCGTVVCLPQVMSVYNARNLEGEMRQFEFQGVHAKNGLAQADYLRRYDEYTQHAHHEYVVGKIALLELNYDDNYAEIAKNIEAAVNTPCYRAIMESKTPLGKAAVFFEYHCSRLGPVWMLAIKLHRRHIFRNSPIILERMKKDRLI